MNDFKLCFKSILTYVLAYADFHTLAAISVYVAAATSGQTCLSKR